MGRGRVTRENFIKRATEVHGDRYSYVNVDELESATSKVTLICYDHGEFEAWTNTHMTGRGCPKCGWETAQIKFKENTALRKECECYETGRLQVKNWLNRLGRREWDQR